MKAVGRWPLALLALALVGAVAATIWFLTVLRPPPSPLGTAVGGDAEATGCPTLEGSSGDPPAVSSTDLIACPDTYDGQLVAYRGEVVGAILLRGDSAWVQLNDDAYAAFAGPLPSHGNVLGSNSGLPALIPSGVAQRIDFVGGASAQGDLLHILAEFQRASDVDGGGPALIARQASVVRQGRPIERMVPPAIGVTAGTLAALALGMTALVVRARRRG